MSYALSAKNRLSLCLVILQRESLFYADYLNIERNVSTYRNEFTRFKKLIFKLFTFRLGTNIFWGLQCAQGSQYPQILSLLGRRYSATLISSVSTRTRSNHGTRFQYFILFFRLEMTIYMFIMCCNRFKLLIKKYYVRNQLERMH